MVLQHRGQKMSVEDYFKLRESDELSDDEIELNSLGIHFPVAALYKKHVSRSAK